MKTCLLSPIVALVAGCFASAEDLPVIAWQGRTMGSPYTVKIVDGKLTEAQVNALKAEIENTLKEVNRQMSNYQPDSELSRFNKAPANVPFKVTPDFARVTRFGLELSRLSNGAFDPTLGPVINLWGFGETTDKHVVPSADQIRAALASVGWTHLKVTEAGELVKDLADLHMDLGAVAKGYGVDMMIRTLQGHGLQNIYASIAGEVRVLGHNPRGAKWMLGISLPVDQWRENDPMAAAVSISNQALSTSGDYQKFFIDDQGRRMCHIMDARTGMPIQHMLSAVTVIAPDSMTADGLATTMFVLGPDAGMKVIDARADAAALFIVRDKDGQFRLIASARFEALTGYKPPSKP
jgi:thiamine biosynthesis lipoprotein